MSPGETFCCLTGSLSSAFKSYYIVRLHPGPVTLTWYGILIVPEGSWTAPSCVLGIHSQACYVQMKVDPKRPQGQVMSAVHYRFQKSALVVLKGWNHSQWSPTSHLLVGLSLLPVQGKDRACLQCSVKSCITDFPVVCAFEHSLDMKTILDEGYEVKFKFFYFKHSPIR